MTSLLENLTSPNQWTRNLAETIVRNNITKIEILHTRYDIVHDSTDGDRLKVDFVVYSGEDPIYLNKDDQWTVDEHLQDAMFYSADYVDDYTMAFETKWLKDAFPGVEFFRLDRPLEDTMKFDHVHIWHNEGCPEDEE